jgi:hypothetical protein
MVVFWRKKNKLLVLSGHTKVGGTINTELGNLVAGVRFERTTFGL